MLTSPGMLLGGSSLLVCMEKRGLAEQTDPCFWPTPLSSSAPAFLIDHCGTKRLTAGSL